MGKGRNGNFIPLSERSPEEKRAIQSAGGKASAPARRKKKQTAELIRMLMEATPTLSAAQKSKLKKAGYDTDTEGDPTLEIMGLLAVFSAYAGGDLQAGRFLYDYGQIPDMKATLEREKLKAATEGTSKADDILGELLKRIDSEAGVEP